MNKQCAQCKINKPVTEYGNNKARADGLHPYCKLCRTNKAISIPASDSPSLSNEDMKWLIGNTQWLIDEVTRLSKLESKYSMLCTYIIALSKNPKNPPPLPRFLVVGPEAPEDEMSVELIAAPTIGPQLTRTVETIQGSGMAYNQL